MEAIENVGTGKGRRQENKWKQINSAGAMHHLPTNASINDKIL